MDTNKWHFKSKDFFAASFTRSRWDIFWNDVIRGRHRKYTVQFWTTKEDAQPGMKADELTLHECPDVPLISKGE